MSEIISSIYKIINTLSASFRRAGIKNPSVEAKKYLIKKESKTPIEFYDVYP